MKAYIVLGVVAVVFSPATIVGMVINDLTYWLVWDIAAIIAFPVIGYALIRAGMDRRTA